MVAEVVAIPGILRFNKIAQILRRRCIKFVQERSHICTTLAWKGTTSRGSVCPNGVVHEPSQPRHSHVAFADLGCRHRQYHRDSSPARPHATRDHLTDSAA